MDLVPLRVRFRMGCTFASETALQSIDRITEMAGAVSILQRFPWSDTSATPAPPRSIWP